MKNRFYIFSFLFSGLVLFSILFQSVHSYEHFAAKINEKQCVHRQNSNKVNIAHTHSSFDHCAICEFSFVPFCLSDSYIFQIKKNLFASKYSFFYKRKITILFKGSLFALRAPPMA